MINIEISFDRDYIPGKSAPHIVTSDKELFKRIVSCIPDMQHFQVTHINDEGKITGRGSYVAGKKFVFVLNEGGTCSLDIEGLQSEGATS